MALDLTGVENCRRACRGQDHVFNVTGVKASPVVAKARPASHYYPTMMLEHCLLEAARLEEVASFLYTSSVGVYAPAEVFEEDRLWEAMPSVNDWYAGWAKRMGEVQVEAYRQEYGWDHLTVVRPANIYGPWDNFDSENAMVIPSLIKRALNCKSELVIWGDGSPVRDFIHARDVARGMMTVAENNPRQPVNLGSGTGHSIRQLAECIVKNLPGAIRLSWDTTKPNGDLKRVMNTDRAAALGFKAEISLEDGLREVMEWYIQNRDQTATRYDIFDRKR